MTAFEQKYGDRRDAPRSNSIEDNSVETEHKCIQERFLGTLDANVAFIKETVAENKRTQDEQNKKQESYNQKFFLKFEEMGTCISELPDQILEKIAKQKKNKLLDRMSNLKFAILLLGICSTIIGGVFYIADLIRKFNIPAP